MPSDADDRLAAVGRTVKDPGAGYLMVAADGGIFNFSSLPFSGSLGDRPPSSPVVAVAAID